MKRRKFRLLSILMALCMVLDLLSGTAWAADKLPTPTGLEWVTEEREIENGDLTEYVYPGCFIFNQVEGCENYDVVIYNANDNSVVSHFSISATLGKIRSCESFWYDEVRESGTYYFTVRAMGDNINTSDSDVAKSGNCTYTNPGKALAVPTGVWLVRDTDAELEVIPEEWLEGIPEEFIEDFIAELTEAMFRVTWDPVDGAYGYEIQLYYSNDTQKQILVSGGGEYGPTQLEDLTGGSVSANLQYFGAGSYFVRVRVLSKDIRAICHSDWSEMSNVYIYDGAVSGNTVPDPAPAPSASSGTSVIVGGVGVVWTDAAPFIDANDRTMVPLRAVADAMNLTVNWNSSSREASFTDGSKTIIFPVDSTIARTSDGKSVQMDTAAVIVSDRTYAPIRYLAEYFGYTVSWDAASKTVSIN